MTEKKGQLIVALDVDTLEEVRTLVDSLSSVVDIFKVGSQIFTSCGPAAVRFIQAREKKVFLDLKYHDIPNTVANAVRSAVGLSTGVHQVADNADVNKTPQSIFMYTLHVAGGKKMLQAAVEASMQQAAKLKVTKPFALGITVLTSEEKKDNIQHLVLERAHLAKESGLDGVVASSQEARQIRQELGEDFIIVTPGIRPKEADTHDQQRCATPAEAKASGSDYLVIGRPIVKAKDPLAAAKSILKEIDES